MLISTFVIVGVAGLIQKLIDHGIAASEILYAGFSIHITPLDATNQVIWTYEDAEKW